VAIDEPDKIDFTVISKDRTYVTLIIVDHLDWLENEGEHLLMLQDKLNTYLEFIEGGELAQSMPRAAGLPVIISIYGKYPLSQEAARFFDLAKDTVAGAGFSLEFRVEESFADIEEPDDAQ
jgi:hypothetical protein